MTRRCYVCTREHEQDLRGTILMVSALVRVPVDVYLCSQGCADTFVFNTPPEIDPMRRLSAIKEMIDEV